jgi:hypothetical protein
MKWANYILHGNPAPDGQKSLIVQLTSRMNGLHLSCKVASFKTRLMVANGIFASKLINSLQIIQNKAARFVTKCDRYTSVKSLLSPQCGWLSVHQLGVNHSVLIIYKTFQTNSPKYLKERISNKFPYKTRMAASNVINLGPDPNLQLNRNSFRWRASNLWNNLPEEIRSIQKINQFKQKLKLWVTQHVEIHP